MDYLFSWPYLLFELPFVAGVLYLFGNALGLGAVATEHGVDGDAGDADQEIDQDLEHELDQGVEHDTDHGGVSGLHHHDLDLGTDRAGHHGRELSGHAGRGESLSREVLNFLGIGRVPLSILLQVFLLTFGFAGFFGNRLLEPLLSSPAAYVWISSSGAFVLGVLACRTLGGALARRMPMTETYVRSKSQLVGRRGEVTLAHGDAGTALVRDESGTLQSVSVRSRRSPLPVGASVLLVAYDRDAETFLVEADPLATTDRSMDGK
ncbi:MAG: hypothetical protein AB1640_19605 [bacterium]